MKKLTTQILILLCAVTLFAQAPEKFTYQAVVRNANNTLVANAQVGVRVNILQGTAAGSAVYSETHMVSTNANGLVTLNIGAGSVLHGSFANIDWADGPYFLKTDIDPNGGNDYNITSTQQLLSVPYALYAKEAANSFSGDYNDLANTPQIPTVPTNVSAFSNDAGYITSYSETDPVFNAWDKNYNDLTNRPQIPTVPTNVSAFTNDAGYVTSADVQQAAGVPTNLSAFNNDMGYLTSYTETDPLFSAWGKNYNTLVNKPNLAAVATSGNYNDLTNKPTIPTVPSNVSTFNNDAHYITEAQLNALLAVMNSTIDSLRDRVEELEMHAMQPHADTTVMAQACLGLATVTDYDQNVYNTVQIGNQCWMRENLRSTHYADGTAIAAGTTSSTSTAYYYPLQGDFTYGYLYNWKAVMRNSSNSQSNPSGVQGICPNGWHVPSDAEWDELLNYVSSQNHYLCNGDNNNVAKALAAKTGWVSSAGTCAVGNVQVSNNATGFSALPAGHNYGGSYTNYGTAATFWSSTEAGSANTFDRSVDYSNAVFTRSNLPKGYGFSVRCLRDGGNMSLLPTVSTMGVTAITATTAVTGGNITDDGGSAVTARGVCWSTSHNPTISDNHTDDGEGMGSFTSSLTGLTAGTTYFVRAYATNGNGTKYGEEVSFSTPVPFVCGTNTVSDYEGHIYNTVQIGDQCWMKENMRATKYSDGTSITQASVSQESYNTRYYYDPGQAANYGYLYNWPAAKGPSSVSANNQGICPTGWHVPSYAEWDELLNYVGGQSNYLCIDYLGSDNSSYIAKALASTTGWSSSTNTCAVGNTPASNNATGFSAVPAGGRHGSSFNNSGNTPFSGVLRSIIVQAHTAATWTTITPTCTASTTTSTTVILSVAFAIKTNRFKQKSLKPDRAKGISAFLVEPASAIAQAGGGEGPSASELMKLD